MVFPLPPNGSDSDVARLDTVGSGLKVQAMETIAKHTDRWGATNFPNFMLHKMEEWQREGLIALSFQATGNFAKITDAGRAFIKNARSVRSKPEQSK